MKKVTTMQVAFERAGVVPKRDLIQRFNDVGRGRPEMPRAPHSHWDTKSGEKSARRIVNLTKLRDEVFAGDVAAFAERAEVPVFRLQSLCNAEDFVGDELAEHIEHSLGLPPGWLDARHDGETLQMNELFLKKEDPQEDVAKPVQAIATDLKPAAPVPVESQTEDLEARLRRLLISAPWGTKRRVSGILGMHQSAISRFVAGQRFPGGPQRLQQALQSLGIDQASQAAADVEPKVKLPLPATQRDLARDIAQTCATIAEVLNKLVMLHGKNRH